MNYATHYHRLIDRARGRVLTGYKERHHVLPRCMGGTDAPDNLVDLTAEEHYVAHQLLVKMYPDVRGLAIAAVRMSKQCIGNKAYGWLRRRVVKLQIGKPAPITPEGKARISEFMRGNKYGVGIKQSAATIAKRVEKLRGNKHSLGNKRSLKTRQKQSNTICNTPALYTKNLEILKAGRIHAYSPKARAKIWETRRKNGNHTVSQETRDKIAASLRGNKNRAGKPSIPRQQR